MPVVSGLHLMWKVGGGGGGGGRRWQLEMELVRSHEKRRETNQSQLKDVYFKIASVALTGDIIIGCRKYILYLKVCMFVS